MRRTAMLLILLLVPVGAAAQEVTDSEERERQEAATAAQESEEGPSGWWTVSGAPGAILQGGDAAATLDFGGGGEIVWPNGLGFGVDAGLIAPVEEFSAAVGIVSPGVIYQFRTSGKHRPYVRGGYTLLFREGTANLVHFGGGLDTWFSERLGLKVEVRDHLFVQAPDVNILQFHVGLVIRPGG